MMTINKMKKKIIMIMRIKNLQEKMIKILKKKLKCINNRINEEENITGSVIKEGDTLLILKLFS